MNTKTNIKCNSCNFCNFCNFCKNLKMTEYNYFCWSDEYGEENSFQQKRYRVFNVEVTEDEYDAIAKLSPKLEFDVNESYATRFQTAFEKYWNTLDEKGKQEYYDIPHFDWKGFTFITGVEKSEDIIEVNGKKYKLID